MIRRWENTSRQVIGGASQLIYIREQNCVYKKGKCWSGKAADCVTIPENASMARRPFLTSFCL